MRSTIASDRSGVPLDPKINLRVDLLLGLTGGSEASGW